MQEPTKYWKINLHIFFEFRLDLSKYTRLTLFHLYVLQLIVDIWDINVLLMVAKFIQSRQIQTY